MYFYCCIETEGGLFQVMYSHQSTQKIPVHIFADLFYNRPMSIANEVV